MESLLDYLNSIHPLSEACLLYLAAHLKFRDFRKNEFFLRSGQVNDKAYFIEQGLVHSFHTEKGQDHTQWFLKEGDVLVSDDSFFNQHPSLENIQALEACRTYSITYPEYLYITNNFPEFLIIVNDRLTYYNSQKAERWRLKDHSSMERYQYLLDKHPEYLQRVPIGILASFLGMTFSTLSRIRQRR